MSFTPMMKFIKNGDLRGVKRLVLEDQRNLEASVHPWIEESPVRAAAKKGQLEIVEWLVRQGVKVNEALEFALLAGRLDVAQFLIDNGAEFDENALRHACWSGKIYIVRFLLDLGAKVDFRYCHFWYDRHGWTELMYVCARGLFDIATLLVENGADVNSQRYCGWNPLLYACRSGRVDLVRFLVERGADVNCQTTDGWSPLILACKKRHVQLLLFLLHIGANIDFQGMNGWTALMTACRNRRLEIVQLLVENGADVNLQDQYGCTALIHACKSGSLEVVRYLVEHGDARIDLQTRDGRTALMRACKNNRVDTVRFLLENRADVEILADDGLDALEYARKRARIELVEILEFMLHSELSRMLQFELGLPPMAVLVFFDQKLLSLEDCKQFLTATDLERLVLPLCTSKGQRRRVLNRLLS